MLDALGLDDFFLILGPAIKFSALHEAHSQTTILPGEQLPAESGSEATS
jgi:hypothetical protein